MQITQIDLENVKSYTNARIPFTPGTNAICGHNGAGKSTLLEAIGFALFDYLAVKQDDFVREGEKVATVTIHVVARDERAYQVVRKCGSYGQYYIYDPDLDQRLTEGKAETVVWLRELLGVEAGADLSALFCDAVGVPQGLLTAAFLETPSRRKDIFNPLLRVDEYEQAWAGLREPGRWLDDQITAQEKQIAGLEAEVKVLPERRAQAESLAAEIAQVQAEQADLRAEREALADQKAALEAIQAELTALERAVSQAEAEVRALSARAEDAEAALAAAREAQAVVAATEDDAAAYEAAKSALADLEERREARDALREQAQQIETTLTLARRQAQDLQADLEEIAEAEARMDELAPQVARQEEIEAALAAARRDADRLADAEAALTRESERHAELVARQEEIAAGLAERQQVTEKADAVRAMLKDLEDRRAALQEQIAARRTEAAQLAERHAQAANRLKDAETALTTAQAQAEALREQLAALETQVAERATMDDDLAEHRAALDALAERYEALTSRRAARQTEQEQAAARIAALETTEDTEDTEPEQAACPVCEQPLTPEHRAELLARYRAQRAELADELSEIAAARDIIMEERAAHEEAQRALEARLKQLPRPEEVASLAERVQEQSQAVETQEAALATARETLDEIATQQATAKAALAAQQEQATALDADIETQRAALAAHEDRLAALPRPAAAEEIAQEIAAQAGIVAEREEAVAALTGAPAEVERLTAALDALGDPRREHQRAADVAARRVKIASSLSATQTESAELEEKLSALDDELSAYAELDAEIAAQRAVQEANEAAHQRYLSHAREAEALAQRQAAFEEAAAALAQAESAVKQQRAARDEVAAQYDADAHAEVVAREGQLRETLAALEERLHQQAARQEEIAAEIAHLTEVQGALEAAEAERAELAELRELLGYLRGVLREAGPEVTRRLVEIISLHADRLYSEIMQAYTTRLRWTEDYDIVLSEAGRNRGFQQLSGGEQMAAALAVRLALLREVSAIDWAFFDEPTANLDAQRRDNLAEQILGVKGFSQLFVISHDDTFEQDTDHVVRVQKVDGASQVVE